MRTTSQVARPRPARQEILKGRTAGRVIRKSRARRCLRTIEGPPSRADISKYGCSKFDPKSFRSLPFCANLTRSRRYRISRTEIGGHSQRSDTVVPGAPTRSSRKEFLHISIRRPRMFKACTSSGKSHAAFSAQRR